MRYSTHAINQLSKRFDCSGREKITIGIRDSLNLAKRPLFSYNSRAFIIPSSGGDFPANFLILIEKCQLKCNELLPRRGNCKFLRYVLSLFARDTAWITYRGKALLSCYSNSRINQDHRYAAAREPATGPRKNRDDT